MATSRRAIGTRVKQVRGSATQKEFSEQLGVSRGYLADIERGRSFPSIPFLTSLAVNCDANLCWVLTGEECPPAKVAEVFGRLRPVSEEEAVFAMMLEGLWEMFHGAKSDLRAWMRVQLNRAIPELQEALDEKKVAGDYDKERAN